MKKEGSKLSPAMQQFYDIKAKHPDTIIFFRMGDFYEMFGEDAVVASKILGIALTSRNKNSPNNIPLCGVPYHSYLPYLTKLLRAGKKVTICEQIEESSMAKGIVQRAVARIVTPATMIENTEIESFSNSFLLSIYPNENNLYLAILDVTTGEVYLKKSDIYHLGDIISSWNIKEIITNKNIELPQPFPKLPIEIEHLQYNAPLDYALKKVLSHFQATSLRQLFIDDENFIYSLYIALQYIDDLVLTTKLNLPVTLADDNILLIDSIAARTLELTPNNKTNALEKSLSLFDVLDNTTTFMGKRLLYQSILMPFRKKERIEMRQNMVEALVQKPDILSTLQSSFLSNIKDIEKLISKLYASRATPRDLIQLKNSIEVIPELYSLIFSLGNPFNHFEPIETNEIFELIDKSIKNEPNITIKDGGIIKEGYDEEVDRLNDLRENADKKIAEMESMERQRTRINSLKLGFNKVFGYYFEVPLAHSDRVPANFQRKQTLINAERFVTEELTRLEAEILSARDTVANREYSIFCDIRSKLVTYIEPLRTLSKQIAEIDLVASFAKNALTYGYIKPTITDNGNLLIKQARHPVLESKDRASFIPNDIILDNKKNRFHLITGPNMSGKSTYLRTVALLAIMAHIGSFIPAERAEISILDKIFTRVGASDNIYRGESTFMVEMLETANILQNATKDSLIILDEIGRGTSTYDGISIAYSVSEYILNIIKAKTIFATHYLELTDIAKNHEGAKNYTVQVQEWNNEVIFLHKLEEGVADKSYGIYVSKLAGLPEACIKRADEILATLEYSMQANVNKSGIGNPIKEHRLVQPILIYDSSHPVLDALQEVDINSISPLEAINRLQELKNMLK